MDLRTGKRTVEASAFQAAGTPLFQVTDLELKSNGSIVWIAKLADGTYEARKSDAAGRDVLLDSGGDVEPISLAISDSRVYWTKAGTPRSARIN